MSFVALDLETTGLDKEKDKIIEVGLIRFDEKTFQEESRLSLLINPEIPLPEMIKNITGIEEEDLFDAPSFREVRNIIEDFIGDSPLLAHNIAFDVPFLISAWIHIEKNIRIDTFFLANFLLFEEASLNLESLSDFFDINFEWAHRAINDTEATIKVFEALIKTFGMLWKKEKTLLYSLFSLTDDKNIFFLKKFLFWDKIRLISEEEQKDMILDIVDKKQITQEKNKEKKALKKEKYEDIIKKIPWLSQRKNQEELFNCIEKNFEKKQKTVIEAPTGIGKTFAYLIPAIQYALEKNEKVFVSTKTKTLQDQIVYKDLSLLQKYLDYDFSFVKLKGKKNYFSLFSFFHFLETEAIDYEKVSFLSKIILWLIKTDFWEIDELNFYGKEFLYAREINAENKEVLSDTNPYKTFEFYYNLKKKMQDSDIVVINHSLLLSDISRQGDIEEWLENLIIDEAHSLEDSVTESLKKWFSLSSFLQVKELIQKEIGVKNDLREKIKLLFSSLENDFDMFFDTLFRFISRKYKIPWDYIYFLIEDSYFFTEDMVLLVRSIIKKLKEIEDVLKNEKDFSLEREKQFFVDLCSVFEICFLDQENNTYIKTIQYNDTYGFRIEYTYLNIGNFLETNMWSKLKNVFLLSATLKIGQNFDYIKSSLNLHNNFTFHAFESDFNYQEQATLFIPTDLGSIKSNFHLVSCFLVDIIKLLRGNMMILFTSFSSIRNFYFDANFPLKKEKITLLPQSISGSKYKILNLFHKKSYSSVIVGTDSFWEGVDIPWDDLQYLVIHKFPFQVPSDPLFIARSRLYKDAFREYSLPKAIIKMKQGFWRLIRTKEDKGIVFLFDDRIFSTDWGRAFLQAFPYDINIKTLPRDSIFEEIRP